MKNFFTDHILPYIPEIIRKDCLQLLFALLLTILIFSNYGPKDRTTLLLNTNPKLDLHGYAVLNDTEMQKLQVLVKVPDRKEKQAKEKIITVVLNEKDGVFSLDKKSVTFHLTPKMAQLERGMEFAGFSKKEVTIAVDLVVSRKIKVEPSFTDDLSPDLKLGKVTVIPAEINVSGPSEELKQLKKIQTVPIQLKDTASSFDCEAKPVDYPAFTLSPKEVTVQVEIIPARQTKTFRAVPVRILGRPAEQRQHFTYEIISSPTTDITVEGSRTTVQLLRQEEILPYADMSCFTKPGQYQVDICCGSGKDGIITKRILPKTVTVKVEKSSK